MVPFESFSIHILVTMAVSLAISEIFIVKQWPDLEIYGSGGNLNFRIVRLSHTGELVCYCVVVQILKWHHNRARGRLALLEGEI